MRSHSRADYLALKAATRRLVERVGGVDAAAAVTRVGRSQLSVYGVPDSDQYAPIDIVADLEAEAAAPLVTQALAAAQHLALGPMNAAASAAPVSLLTHVAQLTKELGDVARVAADADADGNLSAAELASLITETSDLIEAANRTHLALCREQMRRKGVA